VARRPPFLRSALRPGANSHCAGSDFKEGGACKGLLGATDPRILVSTPSGSTPEGLPRQVLHWVRSRWWAKRVQPKRPPGVPRWDLYREVPTGGIGVPQSLYSTDWPSRSEF